MTATFIANRIMYYIVLMYNMWISRGKQILIYCSTQVNMNSLLILFAGFFTSQSFDCYKEIIIDTYTKEQKDLFTDLSWKHLLEQDRWLIG